MNLIQHSKDNLSENTERKFIEQFEISDWEIETDTGWQDISHSNKTIEYEVFQLETKSGLKLKCADDHIIFDENGKEIYVKDSLGKKIKTVNGDDEIISIESKNISENMYDLSVDGKDHRYYTNGILSHNSTVVAAFMCWYVIFNDYKTAAILANKAATAREILSRVQLAYELLPKWIQHGVVEWNKGSFLLENGSRVLASSTSGSAIRGFTISCLLLDEFAFVSNNIADEFFASVYPTISSGKDSKIAVISTPNGMNHFYKLVKEAEAGLNGFNLTKAIWSDVPGRDQKWADDSKKVLGEQKFAQENECMFIGASNTLISGAKISALVAQTPISTSEFSRCYEEPKAGRSYVMTVDTSRGTGNDYSALVIFDVTELPYKPVFVFADNTMSPLLYPGLIFKMAVKYNNTSVLIETNDIGESIASSLYYDYEYEETIMSDGANISAFGGKIPGLRTTKRTKSMGCSALKTLIENDQLLVSDPAVIYELSNFSIKGSSYAAENGNDDLAMCYVLFAYMTTQPLMAELTSQSAKQRIIEMRQREMEESAMPVGFLSTGIEPDEVFNF